MDNLKHVLIYVLGGVCLLGVGYAVGRYVAPDKIVVTEKIKTVEVEKVITVEKVKIEKVVVAEEKKKTRTEEHEIKHPDGTEEKTKTVEENIDSVIHESDIRYVDRWNERIVEKIVEKEKEKLVFRDRPDWSIGIGAGFSIPEASGRNNVFKLIDALGPVILQGEIDRRIIGPFSAGIWGTTSGEVGIKLKLDF